MTYTSNSNFNRGNVPQRNQQSYQRTEESVPFDFSFKLYDQNGIFDSTIVVEKADKFAKALEFVSSSQLRKFYDELLKYNDIVVRDSSEFPNCLPLISMLIPKANYALGRNKNDEAIKRMRDFITVLVKSIKEEKDLKNATVFFEAVVAYHKFYSKK